MIVLNNSDQRSTTASSYRERRASVSTISAPPPYEAVAATYSTPTLIHEENRYDTKRHSKSHSETSLRTEPSRDTHFKSQEIYVEPPVAFSRIAAVRTQDVRPFTSMDVPIWGSGRSLDKGLALSLPLSSETPHPFQQRDISEADWSKFMQDLRDGTAISSCTKHKAFLVPLALGLGPGAFFISRAVKANIRRKKLEYAIDFINTWNQYFFVPRRVEVVLLRGEQALTVSKSFTKSPRLGYSDDNRSSTSVSSDASASGYESEGKGCCSGPKTPLRLIVASL